jgi:hypothetical protein
VRSPPGDDSPTAGRAGIEVGARSVDQTLEVVVTVLGPREIPLEEAMRESLAEVLAHRTVQRVMEKTGGREVAIVSTKCDWSDDADCETAQGETVNAFGAGERCWRIVFQMAVQQ